MQKVPMEYIKELLKDLEIKFLLKGKTMYARIYGDYNMDRYLEIKLGSGDLSQDEVITKINDAIKRKIFL